MANLSDAEVLAKVRQAAEACARDYSARPTDPAAICARVALAMVEQVEWHRAEEEGCTMTAAQHMSEARKVFGAAARSTYAERYSCMAGAHSESASRILSALRAAVGE